MTKNNFFLSLVIGVVIVFACDYKKGLLPPVAPPIAAGSPCDTVKYSAHIQPILTTNCAIPLCHDGTQIAVFTSYAGTSASVSNTTAATGFVSRVITLHNMPAPHGLPASQIAIIKCWVDAGAKNN